MEDLREIKKQIQRTRKSKRIGSFGGFGRKFPLTIEPKKPNAPYDPNSPYLPKRQFSVATKIVAIDGSGDFEDIQSAINDLPSGGGVVYLKEGTWNISTALTFPTDNISLFGSGDSTIIKQANLTGSSNLLTITQKNGCHIKDIKFDGNRTNVGAYIQYNILIQGSYNCSIENCSIYSSKTIGLYITNSGVYLSHAIHINECYFNYNPISVKMDGSTSNSSINDSDFSEDENPIYLNTTRQIHIISNQFDTNDGDVIKVYNGSYSVIEGNSIISTTAGSGIIVETSAMCSIANNTIKTSDYHGININNSSHCSIIGNQLYDNANTAVTYSEINLVGTSTYIKIESNSIYTANANYCINENAAADNKNIILGNTVIGANTANIRVQGASTNIGHNITA